MKNFVKVAVMLSLVAGVWGCSAKSSEEAAADARGVAASARVDEAHAVARVAAADAHVVAADADSRVANISDRVSTRKRLIPSGTVLKVLLIDPLNSGANSTGDHFMASLAEPVVVGNATVLGKGATVRGRVVSVTQAGRVQGKASIRLELTDVMQDGKMVAIATDTFAATADNSHLRDAKVIAGGAGVGAVIGAITGGKKGAGIGAATGGGVGTGVVLVTKGTEIDYAPETRLNFTLTKSIEL